LKEKELEVWKIKSEIADLYALLRIFRDELAELDYTSAFFVYDKLTELLDEITERINEKLNEKLDTNLKDKLLQELLTNDDIIREKVKEEEQRWNKGKINLDDIGLLRVLQNTKVLSEEERNSILDTKISTQDFQILKRKLYELENILYSVFYKKDITC
jgi:DNA-binding LytR/AlgR family response regulator